jgi:fatty-acyl-CoA synthase
VVAVVVPKAGASLDQREVLEHAHKVLAAFKVPKRVVFAEALPKNPSGKILKRQLREEHVRAFE